VFDPCRPQGQSRSQPRHRPLKAFLRSKNAGWRDDKKLTFSDKLVFLGRIVGLLLVMFGFISL
ncbi:MAG: hypothetical protein R3Y04_07490, partial [Rikenellaceae bacterium]